AAATRDGSARKHEMRLTNVPRSIQINVSEILLATSCRTDTTKTGAAAYSLLNNCQCGHPALACGAHCHGCSVMNAEAIQRVSTTIALLIEGALSSVEGVTSKVFIGPPSDPASKQAQLVLFPYRLAANSALHAAQVSPPVGQVIPPARPVVLDIWYLLS